MHKFAKALRWLLMAVLIALVVVAAAANREPVPFSLFPLPFEVVMPRFLLLFLAFAVGMAGGGAWMGLRTWRLRGLLAREQRRAERLHSELETLRAARSPAPEATGGVPSLPL